MIAVNLESGAVTKALGSSDAFSGLSISCYNSAVDCVVSGPLEQLRNFKAHLDSEVHCKNVLLTVPFGYHSSAMNPLLEDLALVTKQVTLRAPTIPVVSNVFGDVVMPGDNSVITADYFTRHCAEPVQFDKGIRALMARPTFSKVDAWIEIGPHTTSLPMLKSNVTLPKNTLLLGSLRKQQDAWTTLSNSLSQLYTSNVGLHWREVFSHLSSVSCVSLPSYPFAKTKFWLQFKESEVATITEVPKPQADNRHLISEYSMLQSWAQYPESSNGLVAIFDTPISELAGSIRGHAVGGMPLCPASVYLEQVFAGIDLAKRHLGLSFDDTHVVLREIEFAKPLVYDESVARTVRTSITLNNGFGVFSVSSRVDATAEEAVHVHGDFRFQSASQTITKFSRTLPVLNRQMAAVLQPKNGEPPEMFSTRTAYEVIFPRVVDYAKEYHTMQSLTVDSSGMEGYAEVKLPSNYDRGKYVVHPVFMDTLLHVAGFVANMQGGVNDAYICSEVGSVKVIPGLVDNDASYVVYCSNAWLQDEGVMLAEAYAVQVTEPRRIVAHLKDMHFRRVRLNSLKKGLAHAAGRSPVAHVPKPIVTNQLRVPVHAKSMQSQTPSSQDMGDVDDTQGEVFKIVSETCDISTANIDLHTDLASLGVDSLMSIEIFGKLQAAFPQADLNAQSLSFCKSVMDIIQEVSSQSNRASSKSSGSSSPRTLVIDERMPETPTSGSAPDVKQVLADVLGVGVQEVVDDADFEALGLDSLTSIEALHALKNQFGLDLPGNFFTAYATARAVQSYLATHLPASAKTFGGDVIHKVISEPLPPRMTVIEEKVINAAANRGGPDVKEVLAEVLGVSVREIGDDADFEELGLDSLTSIEALHALKTQFGLDLPGNFFTTCATARAVQSYLSSRL